ncbi:AhpC/TSA family protein [Pedobacter sp. MC2016-14]|uniref:TlpA disulfide reductase family protein n=1 Tax=Pedobacter sp. MC2016-14 TaxID=2897327 RepID=UPI001E47BAD6|nr:TlpA disulfide reductase family protein [Pedobacter sp. MC2016-14]MCD0486695.1 AhpC/TSA family protein [Pedobacter sp. MC2016-14]
MSIVTLTAIAQEKPFIIKGNITEKTKGMIYLQYKNIENKSVTDSAVIEKGAFLFKGNIDGVTEAKVMETKRPTKSANFFQIFLTPGAQALSINGSDFSSGVVKGTAIADEVKKLREMKGELLPQFSKAMDAYEDANLAVAPAKINKADEETITRLRVAAEEARKKLIPIYTQLKAKEREFMDKYPQGYVTAYLLQADLKSPDAQKRYSLLSPEVAKSAVGKAIDKQLNIIRNGAVGAVAPGFTATELKGEKLSLADYKGKYVLLDFWASWCKPCRAGNPHLLSLYDKYKAKGFEIIGVSDDDSAIPAWKKAIDDDKIGVWKHVLRGLKRLPDGGFDRSASIADLYTVEVYPTKILIDSKGVIIGRYAGEDAEMDKKLAEIFNVGK